MFSTDNFFHKKPCFRCLRSLWIQSSNIYRPMAKPTDFSDMQVLARILLIVPDSSNFLQRIKLHKFQSNVRSNLENKNFYWSFCKQQKSWIPTFPLPGCKSAVIMFNAVIFPALFGPKMTKISPLSTIILMSFTTFFFLNNFFKPWNCSIRLSASHTIYN